MQVASLYTRYSERGGCLLDGSSAVSRGSLLPCTALLYVSVRALEDCLRFMLLMKGMAGGGL